MNWPTMIRADIVNSFRCGIINAHGSDLPKYRGNACPNWAIICGDILTAVSFHYIDPDGLDTGPIIHKEYLDITESTYIGDIYDWYKTSIPSGFLVALSKIVSGTIPTPQDGEFIRSYPRQPEDGCIRWELDATSILRIIRASSKPFAGAFSFIEGHKVYIWRAKPFALPSRILAVPGQILCFHDGHPIIACGSGAIELSNFEVENNGQFPTSLRSRFSS